MNSFKRRFYRYGIGTFLNSLVWFLIFTLVLPVHAGTGGKEGPEPQSQRTSPPAEPFRPPSVTETLFNYGAGFISVPGLAPSLRHSREDGNPGSGALDEGLGFHQDGTVRRADGSVGFSGPSDGGERARAHVRSGLSNSDDYLWSDDTFAFHHDPLYSWRDTNTARDFGGFNLLDAALDRGLSWGSGFVNALGEAGVSTLVDGGRARFNFRVDKDGHVNGEGDLLLPFYDSRYTTVYTQIGARSMHTSDNTRWIGNLGVGQRWFPQATGDSLIDPDYDAGRLMLGYNLFFDYDFTRSHQRGGAGVEVWYDWLRFSSNYYFPLSAWKGSEDFDSDWTKERPAEGWDARLKAYLPFYRHVALTGAYSQWFGDEVAMFGSSGDLEKDPRVWSYGAEYTPIPMLSGFVTQKSTEHGKTDTEFGLHLTYHFGMPWEDQVKPAKVTELRSVSGSRHEFVDRENKIILEYKTKSSVSVVYVGPGSGVNAFVFRVVDHTGASVAGQRVRVSAPNVILALNAPVEKSRLARIGDVFRTIFGAREAHAADGFNTYVSDSQGYLGLRADSGVTGNLTLAIQVEGQVQIQEFTVKVVATLPWEIAAVSADLVQGAGGELSLTLIRGEFPQPGVLVTIEPHPLISGLPSGTVTTDENGRITLSGLTVLSPENQTLVIVLENGIRLEIPVSVTPAGYVLEMTPSALTQHLAQDVVFVLKAGSSAPPAGTPVVFAANSGFSNLPASGVTDGSGHIPASGLIATAAGEQAIDATVNGSAVSTAVTVTAASCTVSAAPAALAQYVPSAVTFTVKRNGAPLADTAITFSTNASFTNLPATARTNASGQIVVNNLIATASGTQPLEVIVDGQTISVAFTVTASTYSLEAAPTSLIRGTPTAVTFTVKRNGTAVPSGTSVTFASTSNFANLPGEAQTNASGQIVVNNLIATASGPQTVQVTVDGQTVSAAFTVEAVVIPDRYTLTATPDTLTQYASTSVTLTLKKNNVALGNAEVAFEANTRFRELSAETSRTTDNNGQMVLTLTATSSGSQTIQATIDGQTMSVTFTVEAVVSPDRYALVADPASLFQNEAENVTFTVRRNGLPLANTPVAFKSNPYFTELASDVNQTTNDSGQISLSLTGTALGSQTIQASVDGRTVSVKITVAAAVYELEASPASLTQHLPANVTFTVKRNNAALASTPVTFAVNTNFTELASEVTQTTDGAGQIKLNLTGTASGNQAISATVDGKAVSVKITVAAATYDLRQTLPAATLYVGSATAAVFVLTQNGHLVGDGTQVSLTYSGSGAFFDPPGSATVAAGGTFSLNLTGETAGDVTITATWDSGTKSAQCTVTVNPETYSLVFGSVSGNTGPFTTSQTATIPVTLQRNGGAYTQATNVTWSVVSADNSANKAVTSGNKMKATGLAWGNSPKTQTSNTDTTIDGTNTSATNTSTGEASIDLTDIMGERTITVQASVTINGKSVTNTQTVTFGKGPLSKFEIKSPGSSGVGYGNWDTAYEACNDTAYTGNYIDGWTIGADVGDGKMPTRDELIAVSGGSVRRPAAYLAAGWPGREFWTGEPYSDGYIFFINVDSGRFLSYSGVSQKHSFVCRRQP